MVGALIVHDEDEFLSSWRAARWSVPTQPSSGRGPRHHGVIFAKPDKKNRIIAVAKNTERGLGDNTEEDEVPLNAEKTQDTASEAPAGKTSRRKLRKTLSKTTRPPTTEVTREHPEYPPPGGRHWWHPSRSATADPSRRTPSGRRSTASRNRTASGRCPAPRRAPPAHRAPPRRTAPGRSPRWRPPAAAGASRAEGQGPQGPPADLQGRPLVGPEDGIPAFGGPGHRYGCRIGGLLVHPGPDRHLQQHQRLVLREVIGTESDFDLTKIASLGQVASFATIIAVVNVVLLTALSMLAAVLYNLASTLVGGIGVTLTDD